MEASFNTGFIRGQIVKFVPSDESIKEFGEPEQEHVMFLEETDEHILINVTPTKEYLKTFTFDMFNSDDWDYENDDEDIVVLDKINGQIETCLGFKVQLNAK